MLEQINESGQGFDIVLTSQIKELGLLIIAFIDLHIEKDICICIFIFKMHLAA